jgi:type II restriction enzyme
MRSDARARRTFWVAELAKLSGSFGNDSAKLLEELAADVKAGGAEVLIDHLRLCGAMPEQYAHDSSEEKLYSKYTDAVLSEAFTAIGLQSAVITTRADVADVQARGSSYSLVADAKAFRLSRTAKNQKDFKVQAMDGWRGTLDFAVVVCPIYQLPGSTSQIYQQAIARNVCILSFSHLAALVSLAEEAGTHVAEHGFHEVLKSVSLLHPSKSASPYWMAINRALLSSMTSPDLWTREKVESLAALEIVKEESLQFLRSELDRILGLSHTDALRELVQNIGLEARIQQVERVRLGSLLESVG